MWLIVVDKKKEEARYPCGKVVTVHHHHVFHPKYVAAFCFQATDDFRGGTASAQTDVASEVKGHVGPPVTAV